MTWRERTTNSHYQTAVAIQQQLRAGNVSEAEAGIEELIEALSRSDKRALKSQLVRLMAHVIKWQAQPEQRNRGWRASIENARDEIADIREETPSLSQDVIMQIWDRCFQAARRQAEADMDRESPVTSLSWDEVFTRDFGEEPSE